MKTTINSYFSEFCKAHNSSEENVTRLEREPLVDFCMKTYGLSEGDARKKANENYYYTLEDGCFVPSESLKTFIECAEAFCVDDSTPYNKAELDNDENVLYNWGYFPDKSVYSDFRNMMRLLFLTSKNEKREHAYIRVIDKRGEEYNYFALLEGTKPGEKLKHDRCEYTFPMDYRVADEKESYTVIRTNIDRECEELYKLISSVPLMQNVVEEIRRLKNSNKVFSDYIEYIRSSGPLTLISLYENASDIQKRLYDKLLQYEGTNIKTLTEVWCTAEKIYYRKWKKADEFLA